MPESLRPTDLITGMLANETSTHRMKLYMEMVEVGYCSDTNHDVKIQEKQQQHEYLLKLRRVQCMLHDNIQRTVYMMHNECTVYDAQL